MNSRGKLAVAVARQLEGAPWLRAGLATAYHRLRYVRSRDSAPRARLNGRNTMSDVVHLLPSEYRRCPHFFGYYDKTPWGPDNESMVLHVQRSASELAICVLGPSGAEVLGTTETWNVQQGAMAQWVPGGDSIVWNSRIGDALGAVVASPRGEVRVELPYPVQAVCPTGSKAIALNYSRIMRTRPEYGYRGRFSNLASEQALDSDGLWEIDLKSGASRLVISIETLRCTDARPEMDGADHYVNHVMYAPDGDRFVFLHRWSGKGGLFSRLYSCDADGTNLRLLRDERMASHFTWRDDHTLLVWARTPGPVVRECYQLIDVRNGAWTALSPDAINSFGDGHPTYSPDAGRLLTDTYPDAARRRKLIIHCTGDAEPTIVGDFFAPWKFNGETRCDLHPRWNRDGTKVSIDSAHEGVRRMYVVDVRVAV